ncbi:MAG: PilZ domain-containing protein [Thermoanaerobaculia bacterium]
MERRIQRRFARRIELRFWRPGEVQAHTAYTTNISKSGLFLSSAIALMPGERLRLEILDREGGFVAEGRVSRVHRVALALRQVDQQGVGVRFLLPDELVENLVPLARQSGPASPGGGPAPPGEFAIDDDLPGAGVGGASGVVADSPDTTAIEAVDENVVPVGFPDASSFLSTYHRDISAGGLFVSTPTPMAMHEAVWIAMQLPIPGEKPRLFAARVVQRFDPEAAVGAGKNYLSGMAVQFIEPEKVLQELKPLLAVLRR